MISAKKLIKLARKWQLAALGQKRITLPRTIGSMDENSCSSTSSTVEKGHFVVYSADQKRFVLSLEYLSHEIVRELLRLAEEEFGLPSSGPLMLPCDAEFMEYAIALIRSNVTRDVEKAFLMSIANSRCSLSSDLHSQITSHQLLICSF